MSRVPAAVAEVRRALRQGLPDAGSGRVLVACSGGADSLALAAAAAAVCDEVHAVVVDHGLQAGSAGVAERARAQLTDLGVRARVCAVVVGTGPDGPEGEARRARYTALREASDALGGAPVLLGHTLDDQAETVLLGLGRGSGARSLAGMRTWDPPWWRPLLGVRRATTRRACVELGLEPWEDPHNDDPRYTRVRLRHEVLPLLEEVLAGGVAPALARTAGQLADDDAALTARAEEVRRAAEDDDGGLAAPVVGKEPAAVRRRVLRSWLAAQGARGWDEAQLRAVDALVARWHGQGPPSLPGGLEVIRSRGRLALRSAHAGQ